MKNTKIEWCDMTWNPVTGCLHGCQYCYARRIANRFASKDPRAVIEAANYRSLHVLEEPYLYSGKTKPYVCEGKIEPYPYGFQPTLHKYKLDEPAKVKTGKLIFVGSMTDLFGEWVSDEWIRQVFEACRKAPRHEYLFLTKNPGRYFDLIKKGLVSTADQNFWFGSTVTDEEHCRFFYKRGFHSFLSCEPLLGPWTFSKWTLGYLRGLYGGCYRPDWVILGAETGNRARKVVPEKSWIEGITKVCFSMRVPVFMKDSLLPIMGEEGMKRDFPLAMGARRLADTAYKSGVTVEQAYKGMQDTAECLAKESERLEAGK